MVEKKAKVKRKRAGSAADASLVAQPSPKPAPKAPQQEVMGRLSTPRKRTSKSPAAAEPQIEWRKLTLVEPPEVEMLESATLPLAQPTESPVQPSPAPSLEEAPAVEKKTRRRRQKTPTPALEETPPLPKPLHPPVRVVFQQGVPFIAVGEKTFKPFLFFGNPLSPAAEDRVFSQCVQAAKAGVHLYSFLLYLRIEESGIQEAVEHIRYWTRLILDVDTEGYLLWRVVPVPTPNWQRQFPEAVSHFVNGSEAVPSICADRWWSQVEEVLKKVVQTIEESPEGAHLLGYHLDRGEWFFPESGGYDTSEAAVEAFRAWVRRRYRNDTVALRAAWHDGTVSFSTVTIPPFIPLMSSHQRHFYEPRREQRWVDYHLFLSEAMANRILRLARCVREASGGRCLVGVSYGYLFEWAHPYSGHLALGKLLQSPDLDFLSAPPTYHDRLPGGTGAPPIPVDSVLLHRKLWLSEEDYRTPFGSERVEEDYNPPLQSPYEVEQVHLRGLGLALTHGGGLCWMDLWGAGWLNRPEVWERAQNFLQQWEWRTLVPVGEPEVAVLIDEKSLCHGRVGSTLLRTLLPQAREATLRSGASVGFYLMEDVLRPDFPRSRLILFLNAWNLDAEVRDAIRTRLQGEDRTLVWLYTTALYEDHRPALETAREITGIALGLQPWSSTQGTQILNSHHPITQFLERDQLGTLQRREPSFYALPNEVTVLGEYIETGLPSIAVKEQGSWRSVFLGEPVLSPALVRGLCAYAGVHLWNNQHDLLYVRPPFLLLHAKSMGERQLTFPTACSVYDPHVGQIIAENVTFYPLFLQEGMSKFFLIAPHQELSSLLKGESITLPEPFQPFLPTEEPPSYQERKRKRSSLITPPAKAKPRRGKKDYDKEAGFKIEWRRPE